MNQKETKLLKEEISRVKELVGTGFILTNDQSSGVVERPTEFTFSILREMFAYKGSLGIAYKSLGIEIEPFVANKYVINFLGHFYLNLKVEEDYLYDKLGLVYRCKTTTPYLERNSISPLSHLRQRSYTKQQIRIVESVGEYIDYFSSVINDWRVLKLEFEEKEYKVSDLLEMLKNSVDSYIQEYAEIYKFGLVEEIYHEYVISHIKGELEDKFLTDSSSNSHNLYKQSTESLDQMYKGEINVNEFLERYGIRSFNDFEFAEPRWIEIPHELKELVEGRHESTSRDLLYSFGLDADLDSRFSRKDRERIKQLKQLLLLKDNMRFAILRRVWLTRQILLKLDSLLKLKGLIFHMTKSEILEIENRNLRAYKAVAQERLDSYNNAQSIQLPTVITPRTNFVETSKDSAKSFVGGTAVSTGFATGELLFVNNPMQKVNPGLVLVLPTSGPEYAHMFNQSKGIIFRNGGLLSHGAILAREFRIPALVTDKAEKITDWEGKQIIIDADKGRISLK